jgi:2-polyprenyl-6-methoxyphenol hydroxylase-like FAD-dependent oxidoreductase
LNYSNPAIAFTTYERLRYPRTAKVTNISRYYGIIGQWKNPGAAWFRNTLFRLASGTNATNAYVKFLRYDPSRVSLDAR